MNKNVDPSRTFLVAPLAGAWIEIIVSAAPEDFDKLSLPSRERGLKSIQMLPCWVNHLVAPLAGAWIEIIVSAVPEDFDKVAPLAGAWIEISVDFGIPVSKAASLPSRERGLK